MEEKVLKLTTHNEYLIKERQKSKMRIVELKNRNNLLDANLAWRKLTRVKIEQKLKETVEKLKIKEENNLELHIVITKIDR
jgi:hypothetical protein